MVKKKSGCIQVFNLTVAAWEVGCNEGGMGKCEMGT